MFRNDWRISRSRHFTNPTQRDHYIILFTSYFQESYNKQISLSLQFFINWSQDFHIIWYQFGKWTSFNELCNLTFFKNFQNFRPQVTLNDLATGLFWQLIWLSPFLRIIWDCQIAIFRKKSRDFTLSWVFRAWVTLNDLKARLSYWTAYINSFILTLNSSSLDNDWNLTFLKYSTGFSTWNELKWPLLYLYRKYDVNTKL